MEKTEQKVQKPQIKKEIVEYLDKRFSKKVDKADIEDAIERITETTEKQLEGLKTRVKAADTAIDAMLIELDNLKLAVRVMAFAIVIAMIIAVGGLF